MQQPPDPFDDLVLDTETTIVPSIPHSREAEEAVIGSVLIDPNCLYDLIPFLTRDDFFIHRHRWVWEAFAHMNETGKPIDMLTLTEELDRRGQLAEVGGPAFLTELVTQVPTSLNAESYGHIVHSHAVRRKMINVANHIAQLAYDEQNEIDYAVDEAVRDTASLEVLSAGKTNMVTLGELFGRVFDDVEERAKDPKDVWGFSTGIPKFDKKTGGLQTGELVYVVGAPGAGKTWLDLGWSVELAKQAPGVTISLEMKQLAIGRRILSGVSGVHTRAMKSGFVQDGDWPLLTNALEQYQDLPLYVDDTSYDTRKLRATLAWMQREHGIKWFALDYALLLMDGGKDETEQTKIISANLKRIVHDLNLCGIVLHSVTKVGMGGNDTPTMSDQRGSGQAIHDADVQLFITQLYEKDDEIQNLSPETKKKMATLWCSKGRELEESRFKIHLIRRGNSPFWGEYSDNAPRY